MNPGERGQSFEAGDQALNLCPALGIIAAGVLPWKPEAGVTSSTGRQQEATGSVSESSSATRLPSGSFPPETGLPHLAPHSSMFSFTLPTPGRCEAKGVNLASRGNGVPVFAL